MYFKYNTSSNLLLRILCGATVFFTVITQIPSIGHFFRPIMYIMWVVILIMGLIYNYKNLYLNKYILYYIITITVIVLECLNNDSHMDSYALRIIPLPFLCYLAGYFISLQLTKNDAFVLLMCFIITSLLVFTYIYAAYIGNIAVWFNANYYIYEQKNSAAQIIGSTIIFTIFYIKTNKWWKSVFKYGIIGFLFLLIIVMQCRTALVGLIFTAIIYYITMLKGRKKLYIALIMIFMGIIVFSNSQLSQYVIKAFVFNQRQTQNIDYLTSGRLTDFEEAWRVFKQSPLIGTGHYRVDDLYLFLLADVGLIGALPVYFLWIYRVGINIKEYIHNKSSLTTCIMCLTLFYMVESTFEAYPPFGPGVCSFMFWIICAFLDTRGVVRDGKESQLS